jgi:uncharacterized protein with FMN-binding domain
MEIYMKKTLMIVSGVLLLSLAACNANKVPEASKEETTEAQERELVGSAEGFGGTITVTLTMQGDDIVKASIEGNDETPEVGGAALSELEKQLVEKDSSDIDGVSGATYTSEGVKDAAKDALGLFDAEKPKETTKG